jgi:hypothetical protein
MLVLLVCQKEDAMPRFYINFRNGNQIAQDDEGQDMPGLEEAKAAAVLAAREILADNIKRGATDPLEAVIITNESGKELVTISARDVLPERLKN